MTKQSKKGGDLTTTITNKKIGVAVLKVGQENGVVGVPAKYETFGGEGAIIDGVLLKVPHYTATYLKFVPGHKLGVLNKENAIIQIEVPEHYRHGDFPRRLPDGQVKPTITRHFFVSHEDLGKFIIASVEVVKKTNLIDGEESLILNIQKSECKNPLRELRLGTNPVEGKGKEEIPIPGSEKVIAFRKL